MTIDLNCDCGEGAGHDADVLPLVTSANIACGVHAGSRETMAATVALAIRHGVAVGAHPGHADREHFGRRELALGAAVTVELVLDQIAALAAVAGPALHHVKLHGGLYHEVSRDRALADALAAALMDSWPQLVVYALAGSALAATAREAGLRVAEEAFIDRAYAPDGTLVPRSHAGATIADPRVAAARAVQLATTGRIAAIDGTLIAIHADTLCIHGDGPDPVTVAREVRQALTVTGIALAAPMA
jgi:5-oxoprolinase (ATP-hydrolysing) subunit A